MGWSDVDLSTVSTQMNVVPAGNYTFQILPGAKFSDFDPAKVEVRVAITNGEQIGRQLFMSYPDPAKKDWSPRVFKRLVEVLGTDIEANESPVAYLNRVANLRFEGTVTNTKDDAGVERANVDIFKPRVAQS